MAEYDVAADPAVTDFDRDDPQVQALAARRYREQTFLLGPRYTLSGRQSYRPSFKSLARDNWLRIKTEDEAIAELARRSNSEEPSR